MTQQNDQTPSSPRVNRGRETPRIGQALHVWLAAFCAVSGIALVLYVGLRIVDLYQLYPTHSLVKVFFLSSPKDVPDAIGGVAEVLIAILGLVITVVAIVVQLASQRYTPKVIDLFISDKINIGFFLLMVIASLYSMLLIYSITEDFLPFWGSIGLLGLTTLILGLLIPYFSYVFHFLTPENIILIIRRNAKTSVTRMLGMKERDPKSNQNDVAYAMEQISDISLSAVSQMDRNVALLCLRALRDLMVDYLLIKHKMPERWFVPQEGHFPTISSDFFEEMKTSKNWVEMKGFMDMDLIFKMAIQEMPDVNSAIANSTRIIGVYAIRLQDAQVLQDSVQFFNTFLRHALNARNPKNIYNLLYQYRILAEEVLPYNPKIAERIVFYFKFYGQTAQAYNIPLILVTACFDISSILRKAFELKVSNLKKMIALFLEIDNNPAMRNSEFELMSVRKAQLSFASFLLAAGDRQLVTQILRDVTKEPYERIVKIFKEMLRVQDRKFWEVTDRGVDFFYLDELQKRQVNTLFQKYVIPHYKHINSPKQAKKGQMPA